MSQGVLLLSAGFLRYVSSHQCVECAAKYSNPASNDASGLIPGRMIRISLNTLASLYTLSKENRIISPARMQRVYLTYHVHDRALESFEEKLAATATKKKERADARHALKMRTLKYDKENGWVTYFLLLITDYLSPTTYHLVLITHLLQHVRHPSPPVPHQAWPYPSHEP